MTGDPQTSQVCRYEYPPDVISNADTSMLGKHRESLADCRLHP